MRTSDQTHPWINFELDTGRFSTKTWLLLGQAQAKCEQISNILSFMPALNDALHTVYLAKGAHATTAIEGNSLTEEEVRNLLEARLRLPPSREYLGQEVDNVVKACNLIGQEVRDNQDITVAEMQGYNAMVLEGLPLVEHVVPGTFRAYDVLVTGPGYKGAPPGDLRFLSNRLCEWLNTGFAPPDASMRLVFGILKAIIAHLYIAWIHPFGDGNRRTARLLEFRILLAAGAPTSTAHLLSNHYNQTRSEYYRYLDLSSKQEGGMYAFVAYAMQGLVDGLDEQIAFIDGRLLMVRWINFIHDRFQDERDTPVTTRRRQLILDLSLAGRPIPVEGIPQVSQRSAAAYANLSMKTLRRDLRHLGAMGLLAADLSGYRPRFESLGAPPQEAGGQAGSLS